MITARDLQFLLYLAFMFTMTVILDWFLGVLARAGFPAVARWFGEPLGVSLRTLWRPRPRPSTDDLACASDQHGTQDCWGVYHGPVQCGADSPPPRDGGGATEER